MEGGRQLLPPPVEMGDRRWMDGDPHTQYRFLRVLGTGSFGAVYLCSDLGTGELSAIKALDKHHPEHNRGAVLREIAILARVGDHPNVASLREVWEDPAYIFVVQEACMGGELFDCITLHHEFSEREAARAVVVILSVMAHCRARGVLHRDIKPENWLLKRSEPGRLSPKNMRAVDFGASIFREEDEPCHEPVGSTYYVAPEVLQGAYSWPADMWSLGVLIFVLLSGQPPFWGTADSIIFHKILHDPVDFSSGTWRRVSAQAKDFVGRLLEKDPAARPTVAQAANHPWVRHAALAPDAPMGASLVPRLHAFVGQDRLRRMLLTLAARHLSAASIGELRVACAELDEDGDGLIRLADLSAALERSGVALQDPAISELLAGLDPRHEGSVSVDEFVAAALDHQKVLTATTINAIFAELDADKDGLLDVEELSFALEECRIDVGADALRSLMDHSGALNTAGMVSARSFQDLILGAQRAGAPAGLDAISDEGSSFGGEYSSEEVGDLMEEEEDLEEEDASSYTTDSSREAASVSPSPAPAPIPIARARLPPASLERGSDRWSHALRVPRPSPPGTGGGLASGSASPCFAALRHPDARAADALLGSSAAASPASGAGWQGRWSPSPTARGSAWTLGHMATLGSGPRPPRARRREPFIAVDAGGAYGEAGEAVEAVEAASASVSLAASPAASPPRRRAVVSATHPVARRSVPALSGAPLLPGAPLLSAGVLQPRSALSSRSPGSLAPRPGPARTQSLGAGFLSALGGGAGSFTTLGGGAGSFTALGGGAGSFSAMGGQPVFGLAPPNSLDRRAVEALGGGPRPSALGTQVPGSETSQSQSSGSAAWTALAALPAASPRLSSASPRRPPAPAPLSASSPRLSGWGGISLSLALRPSARASPPGSLPERLLGLRSGAASSGAATAASASSASHASAGGAGGGPSAREPPIPAQLETYLHTVHGFAAAPAFKRLAMLIIARQLPPDEVQSLRALFARLDPCASGVLTAAQLSAALGGRLPDEAVRQLLGALDLRQRGAVDLDEFLAAALEEQHLLTETKLRAAFEYLDRDGAGCISEEQLRQALCDLGVSSSFHPKKVVRQALRAMRNSEVGARAGGVEGREGGRAGRLQAARATMPSETDPSDVFPSRPSRAVSDPPLSMSDSEGEDSPSQHRCITYEDFRGILLTRSPNLFEGAGEGALPRVSSPLASLWEMLEESWVASSPAHPLDLATSPHLDSARADVARLGQRAPAPPAGSPFAHAWGSSADAHDAGEQEGAVAPRARLRRASARRAAERERQLTGESVASRPEGAAAGPELARPPLASGSARSRRKPAPAKRSLTGFQSLAQFGAVSRGGSSREPTPSGSPKGGAAPTAPRMVCPPRPPPLPPPPPISPAPPKPAPSRRRSLTRALDALLRGSLTYLGQRRGGAGGEEAPPATASQAGSSGPGSPRGPGSAQSSLPASRSDSLAGWAARTGPESDRDPAPGSSLHVALGSARPEALGSARPEARGSARPEALGSARPEALGSPLPSGGSLLGSLGPQASAASAPSAPSDPDLKAAGRKGSRSGLQGLFRRVASRSGGLRQGRVEEEGGK